MLGISIGCGLSSGGIIDATAAYVAAMTTKPDATRTGLIDTLLKGLAADGITPKLDWLCLLASHDSQAARVNAVNPIKSLAASGTITFTTDRGYQGDGSSGYLDLGERWNAPGNKFTQNSCSAGAWCNLQGTGTSALPHAGVVSGTVSVLLNAIGTTSAETYRIGDSTTDTARTGTSDRKGHRTLSRTGAAVKRSFLAGVRTSDLTSASATVGTGNACFLRNTSTYCTDRLAAVYSGAGLTDADVSNLHTRLNTYLTAIGAN